VVLIQPPVQWLLGADSPGLKRPAREADHLPLSNAEVTNVWSYTSTLPYMFMAWCLFEAGDKFTSTLPYLSIR